MIKICPKCKDTKNVSEFYFTNSKPNGHSYCKNCFNKLCIKRWIQRKIDAIEYKGNECEDCKISFPEIPYAVFEFHHLDSTKKDYNWTKLRLRSIDSIKAELDKCALLCANCHRIRHSNMNDSL